MTHPDVQAIVDAFTGKISARLDESKLDGPVRLDPTRTVVIVPLKDKGPIHVHIQHGQVDDAGVDDVLKKIALVPSLKPLLGEP